MAVKARYSGNVGRGVSTDLWMQCLLVFAVVVTADGFILGSQCMAPDPCTCTVDHIICSGNHLTEVPTFSPTTDHVDNLTIILPGNNLTVLRANAFRNINTTGASNIIIYFQSNNLYKMDTDAFAGIENAVAELRLENNRLTGIPAALTKLTHLRRLHMEANPISTIDPIVTSLMSPSLEYFIFPAIKLTTWPYGLNHLRHLTYLNMYGMPFHQLPLDGFSGLGSFLVELDISGSFAGEIPSSVCFLRNLKVLSVNRKHYQSQQQLLQLHDKCRELLSTVASFIHL